METRTINRKQFIRGQFGQLTIRPPWSIDEVFFAEICSQCFDCARACPSHLIVKGVGGYPEMSFLRQGCDFCEACVSACPEKSLSLEIDPCWQQVADISNNCFASRGIICRSCGEVCETEAIKFKLTVAGVSQININTTVCNGCGECVHVCPAHAIKIQKKTIRKQVVTSYE